MNTTRKSYPSDVLDAKWEFLRPYLTLMRGISFEQENIRWAERVLTIIEQRQGAGSAR